MSNFPSRIFLDTNVYILGVLDLDSIEGRVLKRLGWQEKSDVQVILSQELIVQILRVGKRNELPQPATRGWGF